MEKEKDIMQTLALYRESIALTDKAGLLAYSSIYRPSRSARAKQWTYKVKPSTLFTVARQLVIHTRFPIIPDLHRGPFLFDEK